MAQPKPQCEYAEYRACMRLYCRRTNSPCAFTHYLPCKGWWEHTARWADCLGRQPDWKPPGEEDKEDSGHGQK